MEVSQYENAKIGDVYDFYYTMTGWGKQGQVESLSRELDQDPRWTVINIQRVDDSRIIIRVRVIKNPFPLLLIVGAIGAIGTGLFLWLSLDKIEKITEGPVVSFGILGLGIAAAYFVIQKARSS
ncbi:hypothetical protein ES707_11659 [subsurface metagenome]